MAKAKIPDPIQRRHLIEQSSPEQARAIADAYLAEDRCVEAIDFLKVAAANDRLAELQGRAISDGDAFLLRAVARALGVSPSRDDWQKLEVAARESGRERYAIEARRQVERGDD